MDRKDRIILIITVVLIIVNVTVIIVFNKKIKDRDNTIRIYESNMVEIKKKLVSDSLNYEINKVDGTKVIIKWKEREIKQDSTTFFNSDTTIKESIFSKHTKNY